MSNVAVGSVYHTVIEDVINSSRVDFEEGGVDEAVLDTLRVIWQSKLSSLNVATFPWDAKIEPTSGRQISQATTDVNASLSQSLAATPGMISYSHASPAFSSQGALNLPTLPVAHNSPLPIKAEPGTDSDNGGMFIKLEPSHPSSLAAQRASQHLVSQFGNRAMNSINAIQAGMGQASNPTMPGSQARPPTLPVYAQQPQPHSQPPVHALALRQDPLSNGQVLGMTAQTDGSADLPNLSTEATDPSEASFEGVVIERDVLNRLVANGRVGIDHWLRDQFNADAKAMEGGGLMVPLQKATLPGSAPSRCGAATESRRQRSHAQCDGAEDGDDEVDEDAINSDLDDSDEPDNEDVDSQGLGHIMLCMYDKVARVKNKWKCVLKDGVLTVHNKEYVFHKATGEFEW